MRRASFVVDLTLAARLATLAAGLAVLVAALATGARAETPIPEAPARWATDRAAFLSPAALAALDARLGAYARGSGHQVLVYIDHTTGGVPIEDWAVRAFQRWRVGRKGIDDGAVMFVFSDDRRLRIEVGYGLEERVPDAVASRIINDRVVPRVRAGDHDGAITAGVDALVAAIGAPAGAQPAEGEGAPPVHVPWWLWIVGPILLVLFLRFALRHPFIAAMMMTNIGGGRRGPWGGGGLGGGGFGGGGGFSGGGGSSGGGGASGSW